MILALAMALRVMVTAARGGKRSLRRQRGKAVVNKEVLTLHHTSRDYGAPSHGHCRGKAVINKEALALHHTLAVTMALLVMVTGAASTPGLPAGRPPGRPAAVSAHNKTLQ